MPCSDYQPDQPPTVEDHIDTVLTEFRKLKRRNDELAQLLCSVGRAFLNRKPPPEPVIEWWREHARQDRERGEPWTINQQ